MNNVSNIQGYRAYIDGLRGFAVLFVVIYHAFPDYLKGGFVGVDIFFVISGFVISRIIILNLEKGSFNLLEFYMNRIRRILPSLVVVMASTLLLGWYLLLSSEYRQLGKHVVGGSLFVDNFIYINESGYFDIDSKSKPLLHLWSLGIEWQFYAIWPLILMMVKNKNKILFFVSAAIIFSFVVNIVYSFKNPSYSFYSTQSRIWELLVGYVFAHYDTNKRKNNKLIDNALSIIGILFIIYSIFYFNDKNVFPGWIVLFPVIGAGIILISGMNSFVNKLFSDNRIVWFGLISYPLYLWHWPLISYARIIAIIDDQSMNAIIGLIALSVALSFFTHTYIENPIRYWHKTKRSNIVPYIIASLIIMLFFGKASSNGIISPRLNSEYLNKIVAASNEWTYPEKGMSELSFNDIKIHEKISSNEKKVVYFGDSNIRQYSSRINNLINIYPKESKTAVFITRGGCPPIYDIEYQGKSKINCDGFVDNFFNYISKYRTSIDSVVIGASWQTYFHRKNIYGVKDKKEKRIEFFYRNLENTIDDIKKYNFKIYLILQAPSHGKLNPKNMINRIKLKENRKNNILNVNTLLKEEYGDIRNKLIDISKRKKINIIDPMISLCNDDYCPSITTDGHIIYKDSNHLLPSYIRSNLSFVDQTLIDYNLFN